MRYQMFISEKLESKYAVGSQVMKVAGKKRAELILAIVACFFETTFLRFYLAFVRVTAFVGYKKNKLNWGKLERKKMNRI